MDEWIVSSVEVYDSVTPNPEIVHFDPTPRPSSTHTFFKSGIVVYQKMKQVRKHERFTKLLTVGKRRTRRPSDVVLSSVEVLSSVN